MGQRGPGVGLGLVATRGACGRGANNERAPVNGTRGFGFGFGSGFFSTTLGSGAATTFRCSGAMAFLPML